MPGIVAGNGSERTPVVAVAPGELHLDIIVDRLLREFKVEANVGAPQVAYKETLFKSGSVISSI